MVVVRRFEYADLLPAVPGGRVSGLVEEAASLAERVRGVGFRATEPTCEEAGWSNFLVRSLTLCCEAAPYPFRDDPAVGVDLAFGLPNLSSTGLDTERNAGRGPLGSAGAAGCFGVVPLAFVRNEGATCRLLLEIAEAMDSVVRGGEGRRMVAFDDGVCTP